jgi:hypothetical protein
MLPKSQEWQNTLTIYLYKTEQFSLNLWQRYSSILAIVSDKAQEERMFSTSMNSEKVWVIEDGQAYTLLYPDEY